ncbi:electron carrier [Tulasnella sp. JGI-2019a]|nr:electron carrier [Tulasnella sp. JGI-2019a]
MSPVAVSLPLPLAGQQDVVETVTSTSSGVTLVIGSPSTAQDGQYQSAVLSLSAAENVEKQMLDRILDEATSLPGNAYSAIHVILGSQDYANLAGRTSALLRLLLTALFPRGTISFSSLTPEIFTALYPQLKTAGFSVTTPPTSPPTTIIQPTGTTTLVAQKPITDPTTTMSATTTQTQTTLSSVPLSMPLPLRPKAQRDKSSKKQLWTLNSPSTPSIDANALLTSDDLARPIPTCEPVSNLPDGQVRRKKACKGCSCGLAEIEAAEAEDAKRSRAVVLLDGAQDGEVKVLSEKERLDAAVKKASKATSSCGSCYLGDAFRCASCPYLGLPAFSPGQKVEIDVSMDDF